MSTKEGNKQQLVFKRPKTSSCFDLWNLLSIISDRKITESSFIRQALHYKQPCVCEEFTCEWVGMLGHIIVSGGVGPVQTGQTWGGALLFPSVVQTTGPHAVWEQQHHMWGVIKKKTHHILHAWYFQKETRQ